MTSQQREGWVTRRAPELGRRTSLKECGQGAGWSSWVAKLRWMSHLESQFVTKNPRVMRTTVCRTPRASIPGVGSRMQMVFSHVRHHERSDQCSVGEFHWQFRVFSVSGFAGFVLPTSLTHEICPRVYEGAHRSAMRIDRRGMQSQCDITDLLRAETLPGASRWRFSRVAIGIHCWPMGWRAHHASGQAFSQPR